MRMFAQLSKVDEASRVVTGTMALEVLDRSKEILDYASAKEQIQKWSSEQEEASNGLSFGNVREMHSGIAAGLVKAIRFDDLLKRVEIDVEVVDDGVWAKVVKGVLTGFSIGGAYLRKWKDTIVAGATRYTPLVKEVSLVDRPCMPGAYFQIAKADGTTDRVKLHGDPSKGPKQVWDCETECGERHMSKADAIECLSKMNPNHDEKGRFTSGDDDELAKGSADQPRDEKGRWTSGFGSADEAYAEGESYGRVSSYKRLELISGAAETGFGGQPLGGGFDNPERTEAIRQEMDRLGIPYRVEDRGAKYEPSYVVSGIRNAVAAEAVTSRAHKTFGRTGPSKEQTSAAEARMQERMRLLGIKKFDDDMYDLAKANPHHDAQGRFTTADDADLPGDRQSLDREADNHGLSTNDHYSAVSSVRREARSHATAMVAGTVKYEPDWGSSRVVSAKMDAMRDKLPARMTRDSYERVLRTHYANEHVATTGFRKEDYEGELAKMNPNHDEKGRFTSGDGGGSLDNDMWFKDAKKFDDQEAVDELNKGEDMKELEDLKKSVDDSNTELKKMLGDQTESITKLTKMVEDQQGVIAKQDEAITTLTGVVSRLPLPGKAFTGNTTVTKAEDGGQSLNVEDEKLKKNDPTHFSMLQALRPN